MYFHTFSNNKTYIFKYIYQTSLRVLKKRLAGHIIRSVKCPLSPIYSAKISGPHIGSKANYLIRAEFVWYQPKLF